jgi:hypothetical protein
MTLNLTLPFFNYDRRVSFDSLALSRLRRNVANAFRTCDEYENLLRPWATSEAQRGETRVADSVCDCSRRFDLYGGVWDCTGCADCAAAPGLHGRPWNLVGCAVAPLLA